MAAWLRIRTEFNLCIYLVRGNLFARGCVRLLQELRGLSVVVGFVEVVQVDRQILFLFITSHMIGFAQSKFIRRVEKVEGDRDICFALKVGAHILLWLRRMRMLGL